MVSTRPLPVLSLILFLLAACTGQPSSTAVPEPAPSSTPILPATAAPSATLLPAATVTPSKAPTATPTLAATFTATPVLPALASTPVIDPQAAISAGGASRLRLLARLGSGTVADLSWTPDGQWLVVKTYAGSYFFKDGLLNQPRFIEGNTVFGPPDLLAAYTPDGNIQVWRFSDWEIVYSLKGTRPVFSPDGKLLAALDGDTAYLVNASDGSPAFTVKLAGIDRLYFSPDSSLLVTSGRDEVHAWKTGDGSEAFQTRAPRILRSSFSNDGSLLLVQGRNQQGETGLSIWKTADWSLASTIQAGGTYVVQPDARQVFVFSNFPTTGQVNLYSLPDGAPAGQFRADGSIYRLALSPDSKTAALSIPDPRAGALALYDTRGKLIKKVFCEYSCDAGLPVFSADGKQVFMTGHISTTGIDLGAAVIYDAATGRLGRLLRSPLYGSSRFDPVAVSPDGTQIAVYAGGEENMLYVWMKGSKPVSSLDWGALNLWLGNLSPDDRQAAVYNDRAAVKVLSLADGSVMRQFDHSTQPYFSHGNLLLTTELRDNRFVALHLWNASSGESGVVFPPNINPPLIFSASDDLAASAGDGAVWLLKLPSGQMVTSLTAAGKTAVKLKEIAFSPDGKLVAAGDRNGGVWLWKISDRLPAFTFEGNHNPVMSLAFSPDGVTFAAGSSDGSVTVRQAADGRTALSLNLGAVVRAALGEETAFNNLGGLAYSPDGELLAVTGMLNPLQAFPNRAPVVLLLQASDGRLLKILPGGGGRVTFTSDGKKLVASGDGTVQIWGNLP